MRVILLALLSIIPLSINAMLRHKLSHEKVSSTCWIFLHLHGELSRVSMFMSILNLSTVDDYSNGYLRLRKKVVTPDTTSEDLFSEAEKWELQKLPGYVVCSGGKGTEFSGQLKGTVFSYEFVSQGRNMDGRIYYLRLDSRTFYILHFTVASEKLPSLRDQMDSIARSFRLK